jgi:hypothetical protein
MRTAFLLICWVLATSVILPPSGENRIVFGVRIAMGSNSQMTSFIALRYSPDGILRGKQNFTKDDFIRVLSGYWPSPFNPKRINYFEQENVFGGVYVNDTFLQKVPYCPALDSLWKIRYSDYPFRGSTESGWSNGLYKPTAAQEKYLIDRYHIKHLDQDYFIDTNFWVLLRDVSDSAWVANYQGIE